MNKPWIIGIDPGTNESAYVICAPDLRPVRFAKMGNDFFTDEIVKNLLEVKEGPANENVHVAIEMVASYGMPVGREVFETCVWIGRFQEQLVNIQPQTFIYRREEKLAICGSPKANDATIRQALVDRFAYGVPNKGKGSKNSPGWFNGFRADIWQSYAVCVTYHDKKFGGPGR